MLSPGRYIKFLYNETNSDNQLVENLYEGYITRVFNDGRLIVSNKHDLEPKRFERVCMRLLSNKAKSTD